VVTNRTVWCGFCGSYRGPNFLISDHGHNNACVSFFSVIFFFRDFFFRLRAWKKINKLFTGLWSVRIVKNCDLGLENAALGLRPQNLGYSFSLYGPPSRQITYIFSIRVQPIGNNEITCRSWTFRDTGWLNLRSSVLALLHCNSKGFFLSFPIYI